MKQTNKAGLERPAAIPAGYPRQVVLAESLHKTYGGSAALHGLSFGLTAGRVLGFLGPNGAGKTTAIRILTTILEASSGHFTVDGIPSSAPERIRRVIGVLPESLGFPRQMSGLEFLTYFGQHYGIPASQARRRAGALLEEVGLQQRARTLIGSYSRGMRQRLGIARALVNDPVVVFLDEPTLGLDPRGKLELLKLVRRIARDRNAGVILCSHLLTEVEEVCDDLVILHAGRVVATGPASQVIREGQHSVIRILVHAEHADRAERLVAGLKQVRAVSRSGDLNDWLELQLPEPRDAQTQPAELNNQILDVLIAAGIPVRKFDSESSRLEDVFFQLTEQQSEAISA